MCLQRNYKCIKELEKCYSIDQVIDCVLNPKIPEAMRANFAKLLIHLHLDKDPLEKLVVPIMTRKWNDIEEEKKEVPVSGAKIQPKLMELKKDLHTFIQSTGGVLKAYQTDFNLLMLEALLVLETMIGLGFFTTEGELIEVTSPLVLLLNGCTDYYSEAEEQAHAEQIEELGDASIPLRKTPEEHRTRYKCDTEENATIVKIKCKIVDICSRLLDFQNNARLTSFLI